MHLALFPRFSTSDRLICITFPLGTRTFMFAMTHHVTPRELLWGEPEQCRMRHAAQGRVEVKPAAMLACSARGELRPSCPSPTSNMGCWVCAGFFSAALGLALLHGHLLHFAVATVDEDEYPGHLWEARWEGEIPANHQASLPTPWVSGLQHTASNYHDVAVYMAQSWDEDLCAGLQDEEVLLATNGTPHPDDLPLPNLAHGLSAPLATSSAGASLATPAAPAGDWLQMVGDRRLLRGRQSVFDTYVHLDGDEPLQEAETGLSLSASSSSAPPTVSTLATSSSTRSAPSKSSCSTRSAPSTSSCSSRSTPTASSTSATSCYGSSLHTPPAMTSTWASASSTPLPNTSRCSSSSSPGSLSSSVSARNSTPTPSPSQEACYRGDFSAEPGYTQRGNTLRRGRDRWHNLNGSVIRHREAGNKDALGSRLSSVPEEAPQEGSTEAVYQVDEQEPEVTISCLDLTDRNTTAGEADSEAGLSSNSSSSCQEVGFFRHGTWIPRARTAAELKSHQGGQGEARLRRKRERAQTYFSGDWKPAWLVQYRRDRQQREETARASAQLGNASETPLPDHEGAPVEPWNEASGWNHSSGSNKSSSWASWNGWTVQQMGNNDGYGYQSWQQWDEENSYRRRRWWNWWESTSSASTTSTSTSTTAAGMVNGGDMVTTVVEELVELQCFLLGVVGNPEQWLDTTCLASSSRCTTWRLSPTSWCSSVWTTTTTTTTSTGSFSPEGVPGEGLFPEVTTANPLRNWQMEITNGEVATLQENGLSAASIRRVEELLSALDRHQEQGDRP